MLTVIFGAFLLVAGGAFLALAGGVDGRNDARFDAVTEDFGAHQPTFEAAAERMSRFAADRPGATRIQWRWGTVCADHPSRADQCVETSADERAAFRKLPGAFAITWKAEDGRVLFSSDPDSPPVRFIAFDPEGRDPQAYAEARGYRWGRQLGPRWSMFRSPGDGLQ